MDEAGNFYGAASMGGKKNCSAGYGTLYKLGKNGNGNEPNGAWSRIPRGTYMEQL